MVLLITIFPLIKHYFFDVHSAIEFEKDNKQPRFMQGFCDFAGGLYFPLFGEISFAGQMLRFTQHNTCPL